jgi:hypothetical protein
VPAGHRVVPTTDVDDVTVLIDPTVKGARSLTADLDIGFVDERSITRRVAGWTGGVDELGREHLHPPVARHMIHFDATLGQQFLNIAVGRGVTRVPAHRDRDLEGALRSQRWFELAGSLPAGFADWLTRANRAGVRPWRLGRDGDSIDALPGLAELGIAGPCGPERRSGGRRW